jgi:hypothetical protein
MKRFGHFCTKCDTELVYINPSVSFSHVGTDYWTLSGERRLKPKICMTCRSDVGRHAKEEQDKQNVKRETDKHARHMEQVLNNLLQGL